MSSRTASVETRDLAATLSYLEGLIVILQHFQREAIEGRRLGDLIDELKRVANEDDPYFWEPLKHEHPSTAGMGWQSVAANVSEIRHRLVESYGNAVL